MNSFAGKENFLVFFEKYVRLGSKADVIRRNDLMETYRRYCSTECPGEDVASPVNIGRALSKMGYLASVRVGGLNGTGQHYAYPGICWVNAAVVAALPTNVVVQVPRVKARKRKLKCLPQEDVGEHEAGEDEAGGGGDDKDYIPPQELDDSDSPDEVNIADEKPKKLDGRQIFLEFLEANTIKTQNKNDRVIRDDLLAYYKEHCDSLDGEVDMLSCVAMGRLLSKLGFKATVRVGGKDGAGQRYAYPGLTWTDESRRDNKKKRKRPTDSYGKNKTRKRCKRRRRKSWSDSDSDLSEEELAEEEDEPECEVDNFGRSALWDQLLAQYGREIIEFNFAQNIFQ